ncbi:NifU family protein [Rhabdochlamydiaceae symbiont of Dictyostelium giganteum]|uniref:NifU family protein n=1 Tax=Rhabdochlamydiaceae symbiont of Dictyostelium giganteum TaxID=3342349 RepID=UPI00384F3754
MTELMKRCYRPYPWAKYTKKMVHKIEQPQFVGFFLPQDVEGRELRVVVSKIGGEHEGFHLALYALIDEMDGVIADIRYQMSGPSALTAILEAACHFLLRKNYDQARRISSDLLDKELCDQSYKEGVPLEFYGYINHVIDAIDELCSQCMDIPIEDIGYVSPLSPELLSGEGIEGWELMPQAEKLKIIEHVIQTDIRPYIELDEGGVQIVNLSEDHKLTISYQGSCTSCYSATGSTLTAIQQILRAKVFAQIEVIPDLSSLS